FQLPHVSGHKTLARQIRWFDAIKIEQGHLGHASADKLTRQPIRGTESDNRDVGLLQSRDINRRGDSRHVHAGTPELKNAEDTYSSSSAAGVTASPALRR